jgi:hypothetical protein
MVTQVTAPLVNDEIWPDVVLLVGLVVSKFITLSCGLLVPAIVKDNIAYVDYKEIQIKGMIISLLEHCGETVKRAALGGTDFSCKGGTIYVLRAFYIQQKSGQRHNKEP